VGISQDAAVSQLSGKASLGKAADLLAHRDRSSKNEDPSSGGAATYRNTWSEFRVVAHLIAAADGLAQAVNEELKSENEELFAVDLYDVVFTAPDALLRVGLALEEFGTKWVPHAQIEPLLGRDLWRIPQLAGLAKWRFPYRSLDVEDRAFLIETRRARPKPKKR
jgi:hypothetical protein